MPHVTLIGRILFVLIFFLMVPGNFNAEKIKTVAAHGLPMASVLVPFASLIALVGAVSILLGLKAQWGAGLIVLFLLPVTFIQHDFWKYDDATKRHNQYINFLKNLCVIGGALYIIVYGSGPLSVDALFLKN